MKRALWVAAYSSLLSAPSPAGACSVNEIQRVEMRNGFCSQQSGVAAVRGCTQILIRMQMADQFEQMALARRCGFQTEADKLEQFYKKTTPLVVQLYQCVDDPISQPDVEKSAHADVDKKLSALAAGCSDDLKAQMQKRLPSLLADDEKSLKDIQEIATRLELAK